MKKINLVPLVLALGLSVAACCAADVSLSANTNTPGTRFYFVTGDGVVTPGRFVYDEGLTITNAIQRAGGFAKWARKNRVEVRRKGQNAELVIDVTKIEAGQATNVAIRADDTIYVRGPGAIKNKRVQDEHTP